MKYVLLPHKERFSQQAAGAVALCVADVLQRLPDARVLGTPVPDPFDAARFIPVTPPRRWWQSRTRTFTDACIATLRAQAETPTLIEVHNRAAPLWRLRQAFADARLVLWLHNDPYEMAGLRTARQRKRLNALNLDVVCVSHWVRERYLDGLPAHLHDRVRVCYNTCVVPELVPDKSRTIVFAGRMIAEKGALLFAQACALALPQLSGVRAVMIGGRKSNGGQGALSAYERQIAQVVLNCNGLEHVGYLSHTQTLAWFANAEVAVVPSQWNEAFGRTALEAMAHGCALISSTHGALPEVAGDAALYLRRADPQALADLIVRVFQDDALRTTLQRRARERARAVCGQALACQA